MYHPPSLTLPSMKSAMKSISTDIQADRKGTKRVTFSIQSNGLYIDKPSKQELKTAWYTEEQTACFKQKALNSARALMEESSYVAQKYIEMSMDVDVDYHESGRFKGVQYVCGIEHLLCRSVCGMLLATRAEAIGCVLQEQERQRRTGVNNPEFIARASMEKSLFSRVWRHRIAVLNSIE